LHIHFRHAEWRSSLPRIDYAYSGGLKMAHVPAHNRHAMNERRRCDESITIGPGIWYMECRASLGDNSINRQNAAGE